MLQDAENLLSCGNDALKLGDWLGAKAAFEAVLEQVESPEALFGLGDACWWLAEVEAAVRYREKAYVAFQRRSDAAQAAVVAMRLGFTYRANFGNRPASQGWLARAARLVDDYQIDSLRGWLLLSRAYDADDAAEGERLAREAHESARTSGDVDLELCALSEMGAWLVESGKVREGVALLGEAMAASLGGECSSLNTVVYTSCHTIVSCSRAAAFQHAVRWVRAIDEFATRNSCPVLYTMCRTLYAGILFATGQWVRAEEELKAALSMSRKADRALYGEALAKLAELRLAQGRIEEAEELLVGFEDHVAVDVMVGTIRLARGDALLAESIAARRLGDIGHRRLESAPLLNLRAEAQIRRGVTQEAAGTARRLTALGKRLSCEPIVARGERVLGRALAAQEDWRAAKRHLESALASFARLEMPFETARTRLFLAQTLSETERESAVAEARSALAVFEGLGAALEADTAAALLRSLGGKPTRLAPREAGVLTKRELDVLKLLGEGLSNRDIAERLFLTRKTIEHHVARILEKLGLRSRAQAAAYAVRNFDRDSAAN